MWQAQNTRQEQHGFRHEKGGPSRQRNLLWRSHGTRYHWHVHTHTMAVPKELFSTRRNPLHFQEKQTLGRANMVAFDDMVIVWPSTTPPHHLCFRCHNESFFISEAVLCLTSIWTGSTEGPVINNLSCSQGIVAMYRNYRVKCLKNQETGHKNFVSELL